MGLSYHQMRTRNMLECRNCGHASMGRTSRHGLWQKRILPLLGLYPWQCMVCGTPALLRDRGMVDAPAKVGSWSGTPANSEPLPRH